jgi:hypothetical protein
MMFSSSTCRLVLLVTAAFNAMTSAETTVDLGTAGTYAILAKTGISTVPTSAITGNIAVSPIVAAAMTGFSLTLSSDGQSSTSTQFTGEAHAASYGGAVATSLTTAVLDMEAAYDDAKGRDGGVGDKLNLDGGILSGVTPSLTTGVYTFTTGVHLTGPITFHGGENDVFIIQIAGNLLQDANYGVILTGGAKAENIFWQVSGFAVVGAGAVMQGTILAKTRVDFITGSTLNGRVFTQTACNLQSATITPPATRRRGLGSS